MKTNRSLLVSCLILVVAGQGCDLFVETATPVSFGMVRGKVVGWDLHNAHIIDLGSVYKPEPETVIVIAAVGPDHEHRREWVVEADCGSRNFIRGVGPTPFLRWPSDLMAEAIELACDAVALQTSLDHPLEGMSPQERERFVYWEGFTESAARDLVEAVNFWTRKRAEMSDAP